jgi:hypothetical protein
MGQFAMQERQCVLEQRGSITFDTLPTEILDKIFEYLLLLSKTRTIELTSSNYEHYRLDRYLGSMAVVNKTMRSAYRDSIQVSRDSVEATNILRAKSFRPLIPEHTTFTITIN